MKRVLFFCLMTFLLSFALKAQDVIIGTETSNDYDIAFYPFYEDSWWESVYTPSEIGVSGNISAVALQHNGGGTLACQNVRIYMGYRTQASYGSTGAWTPMSDLTLVYFGTNMSIGGNTSGWETFNLSTPFFYNGTGNLVIVFAKHATNYSSALNYYYSSTSEYTSLYRYMDDDESYSLHPGSNTGSRQFYRPNTKLSIITDPNFCGGVVDVQASGITTTDATISWTPGFNPQSYIVELKTANQTWNDPAVEIYTTTDTFLTVFGLNPSTTYNVRVANDCGDEVSTYTSASFTTQCGPTSLLPIQENFDSYTHTNNNGNNNLPHCWDYINTGSESSNHPFVYYASNNAYNGSYSLRFYTGSGNGYADQYAFLPSLDLTTVNIANLSLGLYMRRQGNNGTFRLVVGVTEGTDLSTFVSVDTLSSNSGTYAYKEVSFSNYVGNGDRIVLKAFKPGSGNNRGHVDDIVLGSNLCATPSNLSMTAADEYSITLQWSELDTATSWEIEYGSEGFTTGSGTTVIANNHPYTITGLTPGTTYQFQVRADCGGSTSGWSINRVTASTNCLPATIPFTENFDTYTHTSNPNNGNGTNNLPNCWDAYNTGSNYTAYPYVYYSNNNAYNGNYSLRFYTQNGNNYADQYAVLPVFDANTSLNTLQISFKARSNAANTPFTLIVGAMSGGTNSFEPVDTLTITGTSYSTYIVYFDAYDGTANRIALKAPKNSGSTNNRGYVDDIVVGQLSNCRMVSDVTFSDITTSEATISWQSHGNENTWIIEYRATGEDSWLTAYANTNPYTLTGLTNATTYQVRVTADCSSEQSEATAIRSFTTLTCDVSDQCAYSFVLMDDYGDGWNGASLSVRQNGILVSTIQATNHNVTSTLTLDTVQVMLCGDVPVTLSWSSGDYDDECSIQVIDPTGDIIYNVSEPSSGTLTTFSASCVISDCPRPASITVTEIGSTTATVSWVSTGTETAWNVEYRPAGTSTWTVESTTDNPYYLFGLTPSTQYEIRVQTDCGYDVSAYRDGAFSTAGCELEDQCPYEFVLNDSFGDGWNGASLTVQQNGITIATMTLEAGESTATFQVMLCDNLSTSLVWTSGNYDSECGFSVYNPNDSLIYTASSFSSGTMFTFTSSCAMPNCPKPTSLIVTDIESTSATISWTNFGTTVGVWNIEYKPANTSNWILETAYSSPYVLMGLTPSTAYDIRIQSDCGSDVSDWRESSFSTAGCDLIDQCNYTFSLYDSYGDGWNNASLSVQQDGITVSTMTIESGSSSATVQVSLCDNLPITLVWNTGNYDSECSFTVTSPYGETIYTGSNLAYGTLTTYTSHCTPPTCPMPSSVTISNIGSTSATVSWVSTGTETAWNVEYKEVNSNTWTVEYSTTNPLTLNGLNAGTRYDLRVQADCGGGDLSDYRETTFNTSLCEVSEQCTYTLSVMGEFDDSWDYCSLSVQQNGIEVAVITEIGSYSASINLNLCDGVSTSLVYNSGLYDDECAISLYAPDGSLVFTQNDMTYYTTYTFTTNCNGSTPPPTCDVPTNLNANATSYNAADVTWTAGGSETSWFLQYKLASASNWGNSITVNAPTYHITGLTAQNTYQVRVQAICNSSEVSDWTTAVSFTTPVEPVDPCDAPTNLQVSNISQNSATMTWTAGGSETSWKVGYKLQSAGQWQEATVQQTTYEIEGLTANSTYDVRVKAVCAADNQSDFVTGSFTTTGVGIDNISLTNSISLMPNPADNYIELSINSNVDVKEAMVYNAFGQLIQTVQLTGNHARIDLSNMAAGMYFVRVNGESVSATRKFIKR